MLGLESNDGVEPGPEDEETPKIGLIFGLFRLGASSSVSWCDALSRLPKGEFLSPDIGVNAGDSVGGSRSCCELEISFGNGGMNEQRVNTIRT